MAGTRRGVRYQPPDLDDPDQLIGAWVRASRIKAGLSLSELSRAMSEAGHGWSKTMAENAQRGRRLRGAELVSLANIFGQTVEAHAAQSVKPPPQAEPVPEVLAEDVVKWVSDMAPFKAWAGQREEITVLACRAGVSRSEMCRRLWAMASPAYRRYLDERDVLEEGAPPRCAGRCDRRED